MKEQYNALLARALEFEEFAINYDGGCPVDNWRHRIDIVLGDLEAMESEIVD